MAKVNYSTTMRALCIAWLYPAVSLVWAGFGSLGLRSIDDAAIRATLDQAQAIAVLLAIFSLLVGGIWAVRTWPYLPASTFSRNRVRWNGPLLHGFSVPVAGLAALGCLVVDDGAPLTAAAGAAGFLAGLIIPRWLVQAPLARALPLAAFSMAAIGQVTLGWIPVLNPNGLMAMLVVADGLLLAWAAVAGARAVSTEPIQEILSPAAVGLPVGAFDSATKAAGSDELLADAAAGRRTQAATAAAEGADGAAVAEPDFDRVNPRPALPSFREPAVGH